VERDTDRESKTNVGKCACVSVCVISLERGRERGDWYDLITEGECV